MDVQIINPLEDERWDDLVARHPHASAFHQRGWLEALARTYGYKPFVLTTTPLGRPLQNGLVLCSVNSWISGKRLVSLPFTDHCDPLLEGPEQFEGFADWLCSECDSKSYRYAELRPRTQPVPPSMEPGQSYWLHELDLSATLSDLFDRLHKDSIQRKIRRADKESLSYEVGNSEQLLEEFYGLLLITRRRHQLLPQPRTWFGNLRHCLGDNLQIRVARKDGKPVAAMLTLRHRATIIYKYGCSDERFHRLGGMPFLFWKLIEESKSGGAETIDYGRSDLDHDGLIAFKDKFGARKRKLLYCRYSNPQVKEVKAKAKSWDSRIIRRIFEFLPDEAMSIGGRILYRHMG